MIVLLLLFHLLHACSGSCYFSAELQGEYVMQTITSGTQTQVQYSLVNITAEAIAMWGLCHHRQGDNVILNDSFNGTACVRCFHLKLHSPNVLQVHTCPTCLDQCYLTVEAARNTCPRGDDVSSSRYKEITLFRTKEIGGGSVKKMFCPIAGRYTFTYNLFNQTDNRVECSPALSQLENCADRAGGPQLDVHFQGCAHQYNEMTFECLGDWAGPNGQRFLALQETTVSASAEQRPQYRCALYREDEQRGTISLAFSSDSTCSTDLYNASYGHMTWNLTAVPSMHWPSVVVNSKCSFPYWSQGKWEHLNVNFNSLTYKDHYSYNAYTMKCAQAVSEDRFVVFSKNGCGEEVYKCIKMKLRSGNVLEFQLGLTSSVFFNTSLCSDSNFLGNVWVTQARLEGRQVSPCPVTGDYTGFITNDSGLCARMASDQLHPEIMYFTVSDCEQQEVYEGRFHSGRHKRHDEGNHESGLNISTSTMTMTPIKMSESSFSETDTTKPETTSTLKTPVKPETTSTLKTPVKPETTSTLKTPVKPETTSTLKTPVKPETTSTLKTPVKPETTSTLQTPLTSTTTSPKTSTSTLPTLEEAKTTSKTFSTDVMIEDSEQVESSVNRKVAIANGEEILPTKSNDPVNTESTRAASFTSTFRPYRSYHSPNPWPSLPPPTWPAPNVIRTTIPPTTALPWNSIHSNQNSSSTQTNTRPSYHQYPRPADFYHNVGTTEFPFNRGYYANNRGFGGNTYDHRDQSFRETNSSFYNVRNNWSTMVPRDGYVSRPWLIPQQWPEAPPRNYFNMTRPNHFGMGDYNYQNPRQNWNWEGRYRNSMNFPYRPYQNTNPNYRRPIALPPIQLPPLPSDSSRPMYTVGRPRSIREEREYQCLGQWEEDGVTYTYTQRKDFGTYECFVGSILSNNEIYIKEAGEHCGRGIDPLRTGMKLQVRGGAKIVESNPSTTQQITSWYVTKRPTVPTKPWKPITGAPPRLNGHSRTLPSGSLVVASVLLAAAGAALSVGAILQW